MCKQEFKPLHFHAEHVFMQPPPLTTRQPPLSPLTTTLQRLVPFLIEFLAVHVFVRSHFLNRNYL